jgi:aspartyl protease family protein
MFWIAIGILFAGLMLLIANHQTGQVAGFAADDFSRLVAGTALILVIGAGLLFSYRGRAATALRHAAIWLVVALIVVGAYTFRAEFGQIAQRMRAQLQPGFVLEQTTAEGRVEVVLFRRADGHFAADMTVNGVAVTMLVDTGASALTLSDEDARRVGLPVNRLAYSVRIQTANGISAAAPATLDRVALGPIALSRVRALVAQPGRLNESLLGIGFLSRLESYEVRGNRMILRAPQS